jgi:hypothetical protein
MTTVVDRCSRCRELIVELGPIVLRIETGPDRHEGPLELCMRCWGELREFIAAGADPRPGRRKPRRSRKRPRARMRPAKLA